MPGPSLNVVIPDGSGQPLRQDSAKRCFSFNEITRSDQKSGYRSVDWTLAQQFVKGTFLVGNLYTIDEGGPNFLVGTLRQLPIRFHSYESAGMVALATVLTVAVGPCLLSVRDRKSTRLNSSH